jgi:hypothetical protein
MCWGPNSSPKTWATINIREFKNEKEVREFKNEK